MPVNNNVRHNTEVATRKGPDMDVNKNVRSSRWHEDPNTTRGPQLEMSHLERLNSNNLSRSNRYSNQNAYTGGGTGTGSYNFNSVDLTGSGGGGGMDDALQIDSGIPLTKRNPMLRKNVVSYDNGGRHSNPYKYNNGGEVNYSVDPYKSNEYFSTSYDGEREKNRINKIRASEWKKANGLNPYHVRFTNDPRADSDYTKAFKAEQERRKEEAWIENLKSGNMGLNPSTIHPDEMKNPWEEGYNGWYEGNNSSSNQRISAGTNRNVISRGRTSGKSHNPELYSQGGMMDPQDGNGVYWQNMAARIGQRNAGIAMQQTQNIINGNGKGNPYQMPEQRNMMPNAKFDQGGMLGDNSIRGMISGAMQDVNAQMNPAPQRRRFVSGGRF